MIYLFYATGVLWGPEGVRLGSSGGPLGVDWGALGTSWESTEVHWGPPGDRLGCSGDPLGVDWDTLGARWESTGVFWGPDRARHPRLADKTPFSLNTRPSLYIDGSTLVYILFYSIGYDERVPASDARQTGIRAIT